MPSNIVNLPSVCGHFRHALNDTVAYLEWTLQFRGRYNSQQETARRDDVGKLSKLLESVRRGGQGFGFTARRVEESASLVLVAALPEGDADLVRAAVAGGAEAVILAPGEPAQLARVSGQLGELLAAAAERPCGLLVAAAAPAASVWREGGLDFVVVTAEAPAALLRGQMEWVARVGLDFEPTEVRALDALGVDAYLIDSGQREGQALSIREVARCRLLAGLTSKPALVGVADEGLADELDVILQTGVEGIVLAPTLVGGRPDEVKANVAAFRAAVNKLGPRRPARRKPGEEVPLLPRVTPPAPGPDEITLPEEPEFPE